MASRCTKFVPNIFNKNKCQSCFKSKEQHSAEALENSKVARKVSKCAYLFVAPDFDFSNPLQRTRRWQRRFFVLYDDGELTYSVDENVNTVPQGVIDMNKCTNVYDAEESTSHQHSIAIETPAKISYIKGTSKEEITRWYDVLVMYPRSIVAKHRRSPTHPPPTSNATKKDSDSEMIVAVVGSQASRSPQAAPTPSRPRAHSSHEPPTQTETKAPAKPYSSLDRSEALTQRGFKPYVNSRSRNSPGQEAGSEHTNLRNADNGGSKHGANKETSRNQPHHESEPLTYRGVRSMKRRAGNKNANADGLRKSNSMHDLSSSSDGQDVSCDTMFAKSRYLSRSKDNLVDSSDSYDRSHFRRKSADNSLLGSKEELDGGSKPPRTLFETLINPEPVKPKHPPTKHDRYMRLASIPQTKPIEEYVCKDERSSGVGTHAPSQAERSPGAGTHAPSQAERRKKSSVTRSHGFDRDRWKSDGFVGFKASNHARSDDGLLDRNGIGSGGDSGFKKYNPYVNDKDLLSSSNTDIVERHSPLYARKFNVADVNAANNSTKNKPVPRRHTSVISNNVTRNSEFDTGSLRSKRNVDSGIDISGPLDSTDFSSNKSFRKKSDHSPASSNSSFLARPSHGQTRASSDEFLDHSPGGSTTASARRSHNASLSTSPSSQHTGKSRQIPVSSPSKLSPRTNSPYAAKTTSPTSSQDSYDQKQKSQSKQLIMASKSSDTSVPADDLTYMKKGWLVKQVGSSGKDWKKFWFVLSGSALKFYLDSHSEDSDQIEGHINLTLTTEVMELAVSRNYGFKIKSDNNTQILSAMTSGIRNNWIQAIKKCIDSLSSRLPDAELVSKPRPPQNSVTSISVEARTNASPAHSHNNSDSSSSYYDDYIREHKQDNMDAMHEIDVIEKALKDMDRVPPTYAHEPQKISKPHSIDNKSNISGSNQDVTIQPEKVHKVSHIPVNEKMIRGQQKDLLVEKVEKVDDVSQNANESHRRSLNEGVHKDKARPHERFQKRVKENKTNTETGRFRNRSLSSLQLEDKLLRSSTDSVDSIATTSSDHSGQNDVSLSPHKLTRSLEGGFSYIRSKSPSNPRAPSAKVKDRSRSKSPRPKSPPPEMDIDDLIDKMLEDTEDEKTQESPKKVKTRKYSTDALLVDLLDTQVESLKSQLDHAQKQLAQAHDANFELKLQLADNNRNHRDSINEMETEQNHYLDEMEEIQEEKSNLEEQLQKIDELNEQLSTSNSTILSQKKEIETLKSQLSESAKEISGIQVSLQESMHSLESERRDAKKSAEKYQSQVTSLQERLDTVTEKYKQQQQVTREREHSLGQNQRELMAKTEAVFRLEREMKDLSNANEELTEKSKMAAELKGEVELWKQRLAEEECRLRQVEDEFDEQLKAVEEEYERETEQLQSQMQDAERRLEEAMKQSTATQSHSCDVMKAKDEAIAELERRVRELEEELASALNEQKVDRSKMADEVKCKNDLIAELQQNIETSEERISELTKTQKSGINDLIKDKQQEVADLEEKLSESEAKVDELLEELNAEVEENGRVHQQLDDLFDTNGSLKHKVVEMSRELQEAQQNYRDLQKEHEVTQGQCQQLQGQCDDLSKQEGEDRKKIQERDKENADIRKVLADYRDQFENWAVKCEAKDAEIKSLQSDLQRHDEDKTRLETELQTAEIKLEQVEKKLDETKVKGSVSAELESKLTTVQQKSADKERQLSHELDHTKARLQSVQAQLQQVTTEGALNYTQLLEKYNTVMTECETAKSESTNLQSELDQVKERNKELKRLSDSQKEDLMSQISTCEEDYQQQIKEVNAESERLKADSEERIKKLQLDLENATETEKQWRNSHDLKNNDLQKAEMQIRQLQTCVDNLTQSLDKTNVELQESQREVTEYQQRIGRTEEALQDSQKAVVSLQAELEGLSKAQMLKREKQALSLKSLEKVSIAPDCDVDLDSLVKENTNNAQKHKVAVEEIKALRKKYEDMCNQHDSVELNCAALKKEYDHLEQDSEDQLNLMASKIEDLTKKLSTSENVIRKLEHDLSSVEVKTGKSHGNAGYQDDLHLAEKHVEKCEQTLAEQDDRNSKLTERVESIERQVSPSSVSTSQCSPETNLSSIVAKLREAEDELKRSNESENQLLADNERYLKEIERLQSELKLTRRNGSSEFDKDRGVADLSNHLHEVDLKLGQTQSTLDDCRNKLTDVIQELGSVNVASSRENGTSTIENIRERLNDILAEVSHLPRELQQSDWFPSAGRQHDAKSLMLQIPRDRVCYLKEDEKLRLYAEKLALEAVIMGEMAFLVQTGQDRFSTERELCFQEIQQARLEIGRLEDQVTRLLTPGASQSSGKPVELSDSMKDSVSMYASLLAEKMVLEGQLMSVLESSSKSNATQSSSAASSGSHGNQIFREMAEEGLTGAVSSCLGDIHPVGLTTESSSAVRALAEGEVCFMLGRLQQGCLNSLDPADKTTLLERKLQAAQVLLNDQEAKISSLVTSFKRAKIEELARLMASETVRNAVNQAEETEESVDAVMISQRVVSAMRNYAAMYENQLNLPDSCVQKVGRVQQSMTAEIDMIERHLSSQLTANHQPPTAQPQEREGREKTLADQIDVFADVLVQRASISGIVAYLTEKLANQVGSNIDSEGQDKCQQSHVSTTRLSELGSIRQDVSQSLKTGNVESCHQVSALASEIVDIDMTLPKYRTSVVDYAETIAREAVCQAQMTYMRQKLISQYENRIMQLESQIINVKSETDVSHDTENQTHSKTDQQEMKNEYEERLARLEKENLTLKEKYQKSMEEAKEYLIESEVKEYEEKIESLEDEMDNLIEHYQEKIKQQDEELGEKEGHLQHAYEKMSELEDLALCLESENQALNGGKVAPRNLLSQDDTDERIEALKLRLVEEVREIQQLKELREMLHNPSEAEFGEERAMMLKALMAKDRSNESKLESEVLTLKTELEMQQARHVEELSRMRQQMADPAGGSTVADLQHQVAQLQQHIAHLQRSLPESKEDYDQELNVERAAHKRELARTKEEMTQLLAEGEKSAGWQDGSEAGEKVKELCASMERTYKQMITDMQDSHRQELDRLMQERDDILTEETRATQSVLDTMRKAHEAELHEERQKREEALSHVYSSDEVPQLLKQHSQEMALLQERLDRLSEQYSVRCVENAELSDRLDNRTHSLQESRRHIHQLTAKNEELTLTLKDEIAGLRKEFVDDLSATAASDSPNSHHAALQRLKELEESEERYHEARTRLREDRERIEHEDDEIEALGHQMRGLIEDSSQSEDGSVLSDDEGSLTPIDDYEDDSEAATWRSDEVSGADQSQTDSSQSSCTLTPGNSSTESSPPGVATAERSSPEERPIIPAINMLERRRLFQK